MSESAPPTEQPRTANLPSKPWLWLLAPWVCGAAMIAVYASGLADKIFGLLPPPLGSLANRNAGWGLLVLMYGCSARWIYLTTMNRSIKEPPVAFWVFFGAFLVTLSQLIAMGIALGGLILVGTFLFQLRLAD